LRIRITFMRIRIPDSDPSLEIKAQNLERAQIGSYSVHFGLSSAN
jgi:hypothetical protein